MKKLMITLGAAALALSMAACAPAEADTLPGNPAVYERINSLEDCDLLQTEFDLSYSNHEKPNASEAEREWTLAYMKAAQNRQNELGCFDS